MQINKNDIKDGMRFEIRNGEIYDIRKNWLYKVDGINLRSRGYLNCTIYEYNQDLTHEYTHYKDIVKVWDIDGNVIYCRDKLITEENLIEKCDFNQGDKILINKDNEWIEGIFVAKVNNLREGSYICIYKSSFDNEIGVFDNIKKNN